LHVLGFTLLFLMLVVPTAYRPVKGALLAAVLAGIAWNAVRSRRVALHPLIVCASAGFVALGLVFVLRGIWLGAPGAMQMSTVYVVWPAVYTVLLAGVASERTLRLLGRLLIVATIVICAYSLMFILWETGWWPTALYIPLDQGQSLSVGNGTVEFGLYSTNSLIFLVPFVIAVVILLPGEDRPSGRWTLWLALGLGLLVSILSGRRGLQLVVALAPVMAGALRLMLDRRQRPVGTSLKRGVLWSLAVVLVVVAVAQTVFGIQVGKMLAWFVTGFQFSSDPIAMMRASQSSDLVARWWQSPWFGWGFGATVPLLVRAYDTPWAFELYYLALLVNTGAIGIFIYAMGIGFIFLTGYAIARSGHPLGRHLLAVLVGSATFLIANATNPYLPKFDYEWVVFLPLAFINLWLLERDRDRRVLGSPAT
jgi:hypothetical protein